MRLAAVCVLGLIGCRSEPGPVPAGAGGACVPAETAPSATVIAHVEYPGAIAAEGSRVWFVANDRELWSVAGRGAPPRRVRSFAWVASVVADAEGAWVVALDRLGADAGALWRIAPGGDAVRVGEGISRARGGGDRLVLWRGAAAAVRLGADGGPETPLGDVGEVGRVTPSVVRAATLYTIEREVLVAVALDGGGRRAIGRVGALPIQALAVDEAFAYVIPSHGRFDGEVIAIDLRDGARRRLTGGLRDPRALVADGAGGVYLLTFGTPVLPDHATNRDGELLHVDARGCVAALAGGFIGAGDLALTPTEVLFTERYGGRVVAIPR
jgi:hypothetical protein